jgi:hypothetical protein
MAITGKKGGSKMIWIIGGVLLVAGGVGLYYYMKKRKKVEPKKTDDSQNKGTENTTPSPTNTTTTTTNVDSSPNTSGTTSTTTTTPSESISTTPSNVGSFSLNTTQKIKEFQDWMDANKPFWILDNGKYKNLTKGTTSEPNRHIKGRGYGSNGANTKRAWKLFGAEYVKTLNSFEGNSAFSNFESSLNLDLY